MAALIIFEVGPKCGLLFLALLQRNVLSTSVQEYNCLLVLSNLGPFNHCSIAETGTMH